MRIFFMQEHPVMSLMMISLVTIKIQKNVLIYIVCNKRIHANNYIKEIV